MASNRRVPLALLVLSGCAVGSAESVGDADTWSAPDGKLGSRDAGRDVVHYTEPDTGTQPDAWTTPDATGPIPDAGPPPKDTGGGDVVVDAGPSPVSCDFENSCQGSEDIGSVSGDSPGSTVIATGSGSKWVSVRITENTSGIFGTPMTFRATLRNPSGATFHLNVYGNASQDVVECSVVSLEGVPLGPDEVVDGFWGESQGGLANGKDDSRTIVFEVRHQSGTCAANDTWSLEVAGNVQ